MNAVALVVLMLTAVSVIYAIMAGGYFWASRPGMALTFIGYVIANVGLIWDALK